MRVWAIVFVCVCVCSFISLGFFFALIFCSACTRCAISTIILVQIWFVCGCCFFFLVGSNKCEISLFSCVQYEMRQTIILFCYYLWTKHKTVKDWRRRLWAWAICRIVKHENVVTSIILSKYQINFRINWIVCPVL